MPQVLEKAQMYPIHEDSRKAPLELHTPSKLCIELYQVSMHQAMLIALGAMSP